MVTFVVKTSYICLLLSCYVFTRESITPLICPAAMSLYDITFIEHAWEKSKGLGLHGNMHETCKIKYYMPNCCTRSTQCRPVYKICCLNKEAAWRRPLKWSHTHQDWATWSDSMPLWLPPLSLQELTTDQMLHHTNSQQPTQYIHKYLHTYMPTYICTYIRTYIHHTQLTKANEAKMFCIQCWLILLWITQYQFTKQCAWAMQIRFTVYRQVVSKTAWRREVMFIHWDHQLFMCT